MDFRVLMIDARHEVPIYMAQDCEAACEMAATRNAHPHNILYIVERPDGSRMCIRDQRQFIERRLRDGKKDTE